MEWTNAALVPGLSSVLIVSCWWLHNNLWPNMFYWGRVTKQWCFTLQQPPVLCVIFGNCGFALVFAFWYHFCCFVQQVFYLNISSTLNNWCFSRGNCACPGFFVRHTLLDIYHFKNLNGIWWFVFCNFNKVSAVPKYVISL